MLPVILISIFVMIFVIASAAAIAGWILLERRRLPMTVERLGGSEPDETPLLLKQQLLSTISVWHQFLTRFDFVEILEMRILEAGLKWSVGRVTLAMLLLGSMGAVVMWVLDWAPVITVPMAAAAGILAPYFVVLAKRKKRLQTIENQFPDALDSLSRALRAGQSFAAAMELVANECPEPLAAEMRKACGEWKLGLGWNDCLANLARRLSLLEVRLFAAAVSLQSRFGGRLNEILEGLAKTTRDSVALRGDVRAISAQGRVSGMVLTVLPIAITGILLITSPAYIGVLFQHPYGKFLVAGGLVCLVLGHLSIQHIVNIKL
jgi:tight adherence protein B